MNNGRLAIAAAAAIVAAAVIFSVLFAHPAQKPDPALLEARHSNAEVQRFAREAAQAALHFTAVDYEQRMEAVRPYFTKAGFAGFYNSLQKGGYFSNPKVDMRIESMGQPEVTRQGIINNIYEWDVEISVRVRSSATTASDLDLTLAVIRSAEPQNGLGIGIRQWIAGPRPALAR
jgi:hypothetical protein